jgi:hypothetical protein
MYAAFLASRNKPSVDKQLFDDGCGFKRRSGVRRRNVMGASRQVGQPLRFIACAFVSGCRCSRQHCLAFDYVSSMRCWQEIEQPSVCRARQMVSSCAAFHHV